MRKMNLTLRRPTNYLKPQRYSHYLTIKELAVKIGKDPSWIKRLENAGRIPAPGRIRHGMTNVRLYSPAEVEEIQSIIAAHKTGPRKKKKYGYL